MGVQGMFITFEGGEGSGKSTQMKLAGEYLNDKGYETVMTREPGGTLLSERIRELLLGGDVNGMVPKTELLLYLAARAQHVSDVIIPALDAGKIVLCDRFSDATAAYQGYARGMGMDEVMRLNEWAADGLSPDLTFMFFLDVNSGLERETDRDRFHSEGEYFHRLVETGYRIIAKKAHKRVIPIEIDALDISAVFARVRKTLDSKR